MPDDKLTVPLEGVEFTSEDLNHLHDLIVSEGWKRFMRLVESWGAGDGLRSLGMHSPTNDELQSASGAYKAMARIDNLPEFLETAEMLMMEAEKEEALRRVKS